MMITTYVVKLLQESYLEPAEIFTVYQPAKIVRYIQHNLTCKKMFWQPAKKSGVKPTCEDRTTFKPAKKTTF
jgi:hypothetical protein